MSIFDALLLQHRSAAIELSPEEAFAVFGLVTMTADATLTRSSDENVRAMAKGLHRSTLIENLRAVPQFRNWLEPQVAALLDGLETLAGQCGFGPLLERAS